MHLNRQRCITLVEPIATLGIIVAAAVLTVLSFLLPGATFDATR